MGLFGKLQALFILFSAALGLALGQFKWFSQNGDKFIVPFLMLMLTVVFLHVPFKDMRKAFLNFRFSGLSLGINFLWTPLFAWILGSIFLGGHPDLRVGFLMLLITPCTDWYLVFTQLAGGKTSQAAALLPWHLLLQLLLLPVYLLFFVGKLIPIEVGILFKSITLVLITPFALSILIRKVTYVFKSEDWFEKDFLTFILPAQSIFLCFAIIAMFSSQGEAILANPKSTLLLVSPLLTFYLFNLFFSVNVCRIAKIEKSASIGFSFAVLARNSPLALAIAVSAFPENPLIALALVIGPLIELPTMGIFAQFFKIRFRFVA